ncbi:MAG: peptidylprolyl isomerase [bacterium]|nr:peptidylprolyl isomerase [bacterium]
MRSAKLISILLTLALLLSAGCVESKYKTRSEMTPEEITQIEQVYKPNEVEEVIPPFLENFEGPALRVNGRDIMASDLRDLYRHYVTFQKRDPEQAKGIACEAWVRTIATATQWPDTIDVTITRLEQIRDQVNQGTVDFTSMVVENSQEPGAETSGGDLGTIRIGMMDQPILEMHAFNDPIGQVCGPFPTTLGWRLILVTERNDMGTDYASANARHLLLFHGLDPENSNQLTEINATRWANTSDIEVLADELRDIIMGYFPHSAEQLLQEEGNVGNESTAQEEIIPTLGTD